MPDSPLSEPRLAIQQTHAAALRRCSAPHLTEPAPPDSPDPQRPVTTATPHDSAGGLKHGLAGAGGVGGGGGGGDDGAV